MLKIEGPYHEIAKFIRDAGWPEVVAQPRKVSKTGNRFRIDLSREWAEQNLPDHLLRRLTVAS